MDVENDDDPVKWALGVAFSERRLSVADRLLLLYIASQKGGECQITMRQMSKETMLSMGNISPGIHRLIELGYVRGEKVPNSTGHKSWILKINK